MDEWREVMELLRASRNPRRSPHFRRFYGLAVRDGRQFLASFRKRFGDALIDDLIHDVLADALDPVLAADNARAFLRVTLWNAARDRVRRKATRVEPEPPVERLEHDKVADGAELREFVLDARDALAGLCERDRQIVVAVGLGEDREEIATVFGTSRANVDQIVSRARKSFTGRGE
jgi:RNA polymerase sigma factor (sigma-70 family)